MSAAGGGLGELSYGSFYLPTIAFGYMASLPPATLTRLSKGWALIGLHVNVQHYLYALTLISFLGAMEAHGIGRAIYGPGGPERRPKHNVVQIHHSLAIVLNKHENPMQIPKLPSQIPIMGYTNVIFDYLRCRLQKRLRESEEFSWAADILEENLGPTPKEHIFERGLREYRETFELLSWGHIPRIVYFTPMWSLKYLMWASLLSLIGLLYKGVVSLG